MMFGFGRNLLSDLGCSLVRGAASSPLATVTLARGFSSTSTFWHMRDFWAKPTGSMHKYPGHRQRKPIVFKRAKVRLWKPIDSRDYIFFSFSQIFAFLRKVMTKFSLYMYYRFLQLNPLSEI